MHPRASAPASPAPAPVDPQSRLWMPLTTHIWQLPKNALLFAVFRFGCPPQIAHVIVLLVSVPMRHLMQTGLSAPVALDDCLLFINNDGLVETELRDAA